MPLCVYVYVGYSCEGQYVCVCGGMCVGVGTCVCGVCACVCGVHVGVGYTCVHVCMQHVLYACVCATISMNLYGSKLQCLHYTLSLLVLLLCCGACRQLEIL